MIKKLVSMKFFNLTAAVVVVAALVAVSSASWFSIYQAKSPKALKKPM